MVFPIRELQMLSSIWGDNPERSGLAPNELESEFRELPPVSEDGLLKEELALKSESKEPPNGEDELLFPVSEVENNEDRSGLDICVRSIRKKSELIDVDEDVTF